MSVELRCPVRACGQPLTRHAGAWVCMRKHSFDQRRGGALNLLQPQDRRSTTPGDSPEAALSRRRLADLGHADAIHRAISQVVRSTSRGRPSTLLDVGCGEGALLRVLGEASHLERHGLDISTPALALAAKASPEILFVVANADRTIPYRDHSFDFLTSLDARVNSSEFQRLLTASGLLLIAIPAADDLIELRERIQGARLEKPRASGLLTTLSQSWTLVHQAVVREVRTFDPPALRDLLTATYRGFRARERSAAETLTRMAVTLSHHLLVFQRSPPSPETRSRPAAHPDSLCSPN